MNTLSLLKPTGHLTLGNLLGALLPMARAQDDSDCYFGIADLHALTVPHHPGRLRDYVREIATTLLAVGLDRATLLPRDMSLRTVSSPTCSSRRCMSASSTG